MMNLGYQTINNSLQLPFIINDSEIKLNLQNTINQVQNLLNQMNMGNNLMMPMNMNIPMPMMPMNMINPMQMMPMDMNNPMLMNINSINNTNKKIKIDASFVLTSDQDMKVILSLDSGMTVGNMLKEFLMKINQEEFLKQRIELLFFIMELN